MAALLPQQLARGEQHRRGDATPAGVPVDLRTQLRDLVQLLVAQSLDSIELGEPPFEVGGELALVTPAMLAVAVLELGGGRVLFET